MGYRTSSAKRASAQSAKASSIVVLPSLDGTGPTLSGSGISATTPIKTQVVSIGTTAAASTSVASGLKITNVYVTDSSYNILDDTALDPAGGYLKIIGTGFLSGCAAYINGSALTTSFVSSTEIRVVVPASSVGTYSLMLFNTDGNGAIYLNLGVSNYPTFTTSAGSLGSIYETTGFTQSVSASGDSPFTYSLYSGSLPPGATLNTNGTISGTSQAESGSSTYSFVVNVKDAQGQDTTRSFSLTINTDTVSWSSPTSNQVISSYEYAPISNVTAAATSAAGYGVLYSANTVPTGITVNANTGLISGTVNTVGNTNTRLTATANTTGRNATRDVQFVVNPDVVTWSTPADNASYSLAGNELMSNVTLSATSAAGFNVTYTANTLPTGVTLSGSTISGTPTTEQTINTLLTATAATTGRTATRNISWSVNLGDIYFKYVTLLLNGATPTTTFIDDASANDLQLTIAGDTRPSNFNPYSEGFYSNYFDGSGDYLTGASNAALSVGTNQYTVEFWIYFNSVTATNEIFRTSTDTTSGRLAVYYNAGSLQLTATGGAGSTSASYTFAAGQWYHVAGSRDSSNNQRLFVNGVLLATTTSNNNYSQSGFTLGAGQASGFLNGYTSNLRLIVGSALYNSNFTPSTTPLTAVSGTQLLACQSNRIIDNSPNNFSLTGNGDTKVTGFHPFTTSTTASYNTLYSTYFDATLDALYVVGTTPFQFSTGDFTVEAWIYPTANGSDGSSFIAGTYDGANGGWAFYLTSNTNLMFRNGDSSVITSSATTVSLNTWQHVAAVRSGGSLSFYLDGTKIGTSQSFTADITRNNTYGCSIGRYYTSIAQAGGYLPGYVSNLRVTKGQALYTGNFTPATAPLTITSVGTTGANVVASLTSTNVSLLTCQNATLIDNSTNAFTITSNGDARPVAVSPFTVSTANTTLTSLGSGYFDGTGDYLTVPGDQRPTGDFTVEAWFYPTIAFSQTLTTAFTFGNEASGRLNFGFNSTGVPATDTYAGAGPVAYGTTTLKVNSWNHVAWVRVGSTVSAYINGVLSGTGTYSGTLGNATNMYIGSVSSGAAYFTGYISNFRFVKGTALYTANFLPTQTPLTAVTNTSLLTCQTNGGATNNGFVDQSSFNNIITRNGNATQGTFSPYGDNWSNYFDGTGDYLSVAATHTVYASASENFTVEFFMYMTAAQSSYMICAWAGTPYDYVFIKSTGFELNCNNTYPAFSYILQQNTWYHVAFSRISNVIYCYVNGQMVGSGVSNSSSFGRAASALQIGQWTSTPAYNFPGYISNFRFIKGTGLYTTNFTPSTSPLTAVANTSLLTCQSNRLIDTSPNNFAITKNGDTTVQKFSPFSTVTVPKYYSNYFDGTGDYLQTPASSLTTLIGGSGSITTTSTFTIECWVYQTQRQTYDFGCMIGDMGTNGSIYWGFGPNATGKLALRWNDGTTKTAVGDSTIPLNTWTHIALSIDSGTIKMFVDGVLQTITGTSSTTNQSGTLGYLLIGGFYTFGTTYGYYGNISNLRITKSALYSTTFTPSTSPLTAVANTSLLTCQSSTLVDNSTNYLTLTAAGDVRPISVSPFTPTASSATRYSPATFGGSMYFDGTGDYLSYTAPLVLSGTFTAQCWFFNTSASGAQQTLFSFNSASGNGYGSLRADCDLGNVQYNLTVNLGTSGIGWSRTLSTNTAYTKKVWNHLLITRDSSNLVRVFLNGVQIASGTQAGILYNTSTTHAIGCNNLPGTATNPFTGYISDIQLINGSCLYNSNFVPPSAPLTPIAYSNNRTDLANTATATLLLSGTSGGIIDQSRSVIIETVGNVQLANTSPYATGGKSFYFDGSGDYATINSGFFQNYNFGTGDFTIECWINPSSFSADRVIVSSYATWASSVNFYLGTRAGSPNIIIFRGGDGTPISLNGNTALNANQWVHVAVSRASGVTKMFVGGVEQSATHSGSVNLGNTVRPLVIGSDDAGAPAELFVGYITDLRITKGAARYTTNFTPPTSSLQTL